MLQKSWKLLFGGVCLMLALCGCTAESMPIDEFAHEASRFGCYVQYVSQDAYDWDAFYGNPDALFMDCFGCDGFYFFDYRHVSTSAKRVYDRYVSFFDDYRHDHPYAEQSILNADYFEMVAENDWGVPTLFSIRRVDDTILFFSGSPGCANVVDELTDETDYDELH